MLVNSLDLQMIHLQHLPGLLVDAVDSFGCSTRITNLGDTADSPGPGTYTPAICGTNEPAFSMSGAMPRIVVEKGPGPAEYTPSDIKSTTAPAYTIAGRPDTSSSDAALASNPGWHVHTRQCRFVQRPAHTILGKGIHILRQCLTRAWKVRTACPWAHRAGLFHWWISRASGSGARLTEFGPGSTRLAQTCKQSPPAYSIPVVVMARQIPQRQPDLTWKLHADGGRLQAQSVSIFNGSAFIGAAKARGSLRGLILLSYRCHRAQVTAYSMGTPSKKVSSRQGSDPGPGSYSPSLNAYKHTASAFSMGKPSVRKGDKISRTPGPGNYDAGMPTRYRSPAFNRWQARCSKSSDCNAWTATLLAFKSKLVSRSWVFNGQRPTQGRAMPRTPAPGQYDAADHKTRSPAWVIKPSMSSRSMQQTTTLVLDPISQAPVRWEKLTAKSRGLAVRC